MLGRAQVAGDWDGIARYKPHVATHPACRR
jgi:hypothetical protein